MNTYHAHLMPWMDGGASSSASRRTPGTCVATPSRIRSAIASSSSPRISLMFRLRRREPSTTAAPVVPPHDGDDRATADRAAQHADRADHAGHLAARHHGVADDACPAVDTADDRCAGDDDQLVSHDVDDVDDDRVDDHDDDHRLLDVVDHLDVHGAVRAVIGGRARQTSCARSPSAVVLRRLARVVATDVGQAVVTALPQR